MTRRGILLIAVGACLIAPLTMLAQALLDPLRVSATLLLFCFGPGAALLPLLTPSGRPRAELGLVIATSLAVVTMLALLTLLTRAWAPGAMTLVLAAVCLPALVVQLLAPE
jgi:hypothetical protein